MRALITCYKETGKYYGEKEVELPDLYIEGPGGNIQDVYATRDYILDHPETWPVTHLTGFFTTIALVDPDGPIGGIPIMIPKGFEKPRPYQPISA